MTKITLCKECNVETNNGMYCKLCAPYMNPNKETNVKVLTQQQKDFIKTRKNELRNELIEKLYGADAVLNNELMFMERNASSIAFEATKCGQNLSDVLTRTEMEDLVRDDREYEKCPHDLIDYGARESAAYTRQQIREFMSGKETAPVSEEVAEVLEDTGIKQTFIPQEQKELNLEYYTNKIKNAKKVSTIGWIGKVVFDGIKASERTFKVYNQEKLVLEDLDQEFLTELMEKYDLTAEQIKASVKEGELTHEVEEEITAPTFFPKGSYKDFWAFYKKAKEDLAAQVSDTNKVSYTKVKDIVNKATLETNKESLLEVIDYELSLLDTQTLWNSLKYAKEQQTPFAYDVFKSILANAKNTKSA